MPTIVFKDVNYAYVDTNETFEALEDINLEIRDGEFLCLVGHSGCGKSTMLSLIAGLAQPTSGEILIDGKPVEILPVIPAGSECKVEVIMGN